VIIGSLKICHQVLQRLVTAKNNKQETGTLGTAVLCIANFLKRVGVCRRACACARARVRVRVCVCVLQWVYDEQMRPRSLANNSLCLAWVSAEFSEGTPGRVTLNQCDGFHSSLS
jgi:hypothetical protein